VAGIDLPSKSDLLLAVYLQAPIGIPSVTNANYVNKKLQAFYFMDDTIVSNSHATQSSQRSLQWSA